MLPTVIKTRRFLKFGAIAVTALSLSVAAVAPAQAFGRSERGFVQGVAATLLVGAILRDARLRSRAPTYAPVYAPVYAQPQPVPLRPVYRNYVPASSIYQTPAAQAFNSYAPSQRYAIQQRLAAQGYYRSGIDGSFGPGTFYAVTEYARDTGNSAQMATTRGAFGVYDSLIY